MSERLLERLRRDVRRYDFYRMVFTLMKLGIHPGKELRMVPRRGGYFPGRDLDDLREGIPGGEIEEWEEALPPQVRAFKTLTINFLGLLGSSSVLPFYFNDIASSDTSLGYNLAGLLEVINDRLYQVLFRVWAVPRRIGRSREEVTADQDHVLACCGLAHELLGIPLPLIRVAYLMHPTRSSWGLRLFARDVLKVPVKINENVPFKVRMDRKACSLVGRHAHRLGVNLIPGRWVTDISMYYRIEVGPVNYETFLTFLPEAPNYRRLLYILNLYTPTHLKYDIQIRLKAEDVSKVTWRLGKRESRLGFATALESGAISGELRVRWRPPERRVRRISYVRHRQRSGREVVLEKLELNVMDDE